MSEHYAALGLKSDATLADIKKAFRQKASQFHPDRNTAERLKGSRIFISRASFPTPSPDEYYWVDLMGLQVINREGIELGTVTDLMSTGPNTVLVLQWQTQDETHERMIPFVSAFVDAVDVPGRRISVDWQADY